MQTERTRKVNNSLEQLSMGGSREGIFKDHF